MPYDTVDDTLVGIVNNTAKPVYAVQLSGESTGTDLFGFDGDGICTYGPTAAPTRTAPPVAAPAQVGGPANLRRATRATAYCNASQLAGSAGPTGLDPNGSDYEGPNNTFSNISPDETTRRRQLHSPTAPRPVHLLLAGGVTGAG